MFFFVSKQTSKSAVGLQRECSAEDSGEKKDEEEDEDTDSFIISKHLL